MQLTNSSTNKSRPFLRWAGSKKKLLPELSKFWGNHYDRYFEPFAGSACLFFSIKPHRAILSDINKELIDTFVMVKEAPVELHEKVISIKKSKESYYKIRAQDSENMSIIDRASRFIFLNRYCFNGLYRTNRAGKFNVPYGAEKSGNIPGLDVFLSCSEALSNADPVHSDFYNILHDQVGKNDFVYLDPPYSVKNGKIFNEYSKDIFSVNDLSRVKELLTLIDKRGSYFLLSYADCEEVREMFPEWEVREVEAQRNISGFAKHRRIAKELLVSNIGILNAISN